MTYTQLTDVADRVRRELATHQNNLEAAKAAFASVSSGLTSMGTSYGTWASEVNALATANPNDAAVQALKADKDRMVTEFNSTKTRADALTSAVNGI